MTQLLPTAVLELNFRKAAAVSSSSIFLTKAIGNDFDDIPVERKLKREVSLPAGIENWNISNYDSYLNFEENATLGQMESSVIDDGIVPEGDHRARCPSISSVSSFHDDFPSSKSNYPIKTFSTVCVDSGSTCISSDMSYISSKSTQHDWLDPEETYQNLDVFLQEVPDISLKVEPLPISLPSTSSYDDTTEFTTLNSSRLNSSGFEGYTEKKIARGVKRPLDSLSEDEVFAPKQEFQVDEECKYGEVRRKNNLASKNCRKTRKEKQRDMEQRVTELEQEKETLRVKVQVLEELIQAHKTCLLNAIVQKR